MPIHRHQFEALIDGDEEGIPPGAAPVLRFLAECPESAFRPAEIAAETGVERDALNAVLPALESRGLVRGRADYWAVGDEHRLAGLAGSIHSTRSVNDELGVEDADDWMEHAAGEKG